MGNFNRSVIRSNNSRKLFFHKKHYLNGGSLDKTLSIGSSSRIKVPEPYSPVITGTNYINNGTVHPLYGVDFKKKKGNIKFNI